MLPDSVVDRMPKATIRSKYMLQFITFLIGLVTLMPQHAFSQNSTTDNALVLVLLGPPGSGKGTQAVELSRRFTIPHISTGDLFRFNMKEDTALGRQAKEFINKGLLVPDSLVLDMLFDRLKNSDCAKGFLLDGFPRTVPQAQSLDTHLKTLSHRLIVIDLQVSDAEVVRRITGRRTCASCGKIYHIQTTPPKKEGVCDSCQGTLTQRADDTREVVESRLKVYHEQTKPLEDYYRNKGVLHTVDGTQSPGSVFEQMCTVINKK